MPYIEQADIVIWAAGYQTNSIQVKEGDKVLPLWAKQQFTQFDVDNKCRIITADNHLLNKTFGSGLAFPMRSNDGQIISDQDRANPRADSFSLYLNFVAN